MRKTILLFSLALLLCGCATTKHTAKSTVQTETNKDISAHLDSLVREQVAMQFERMAAMTAESITDAVIFDTDKPPVDSTGLPPVKAVLRTQTKQTQQSQEKAAVETTTDVQVEAETTDRSMETSQSEQVEEKKPSAGMGFFRLGTGIFLLAVSVFAFWIFYKRIKR